MSLFAVVVIFRTPSGLRRFGSGGSLNKQHVFESRTCVLPMTCNGVSSSQVTCRLHYFARCESELSDGILSKIPSVC